MDKLLINWCRISSINSMVARDWITTKQSWASRPHWPHCSSKVSYYYCYCCCYYCYCYCYCYYNYYYYCCCYYYYYYSSSSSSSSSSFCCCYENSPRCQYSKMIFTYCLSYNWKQNEMRLQNLHMLMNHFPCRTTIFNTLQRENLPLGGRAYESPALWGSRKQVALKGHSGKQWSRVVWFFVQKNTPPPKKKTGSHIRCWLMILTSSLG